MSPRATRLLAELSIRGVEVSHDGARLRLRPSSALTPELIEELRALKGEILRLLGSRALARLREAGGWPGPEEWRVLVALARAGRRGMREAELARQARVEREDLGRVLAQLERRGEVRGDGVGGVRLVVC
ncbi:MAG TPA: hypothetical protein VHQ90_17020 [Thermoanaerobaculia bacterium]|nr:hypothetical protein [Thermoanaerobaculia bacterium]